MDEVTRGRSRQTVWKPPSWITGHFTLESTLGALQGWNPLDPLVRLDRVMTELQPAVELPNLQLA